MDIQKSEKRNQFLQIWNSKMKNICLKDFRDESQNSFTDENKKQKKRKNEQGFVVADFLFSFILVIGCGMVIFGLTFSLMTIEVSQYITWSSARAYSAGAPNKNDSELAGRTKFSNLKAAFPLLDNGSWFSLETVKIAADHSGELQADRSNTSGGQSRHPWSGATTTLRLKLFESLRIPFIGPIARSDTFNMPLNAFLIRNPSRTECQVFFERRFTDGINQVEDLKVNAANSTAYVAIEDNGC